MLSLYGQKRLFLWLTPSRSHALILVSKLVTKKLENSPRSCSDRRSMPPKIEQCTLYCRSQNILSHCSFKLNDPSQNITTIYWSISKLNYSQHRVRQDFFYLVLMWQHPTLLFRGWNDDVYSRFSHPRLNNSYQKSRIKNMQFKQIPYNTKLACYFSHLLLFFIFGTVCTPKWPNRTSNCLLATKYASTQ